MNNNEKISQELSQISEEELEKLTLRKACKKYFSDTFESMDKNKRQEAFYKLLKRVILLETLLDTDKQIKSNLGAILEEDK